MQSRPGWQPGPLQINLSVKASPPCSPCPNGLHALDLEATRHLPFLKLLLSDILLHQSNTSSKRDLSCGETIVPNVPF